MKALVWQEPYRVDVIDVDDPVASEAEVLIRVQCVGICGSDVTAYRGKMGTERPGAIRGHEFSGTVEESHDERWPIGTRVAVNPVVTCGRCASCIAGRSTSCPSLRIIGVHLPGAFAERVAVPVAQLHRLPDLVSWTAGASVEPLAQALHDVRRAQTVRTLGDALVIGGGSIGMGIAQMLRVADAGSVTVVERDKTKHPAIREAAALPASLADLASASFDTVFDVVGSQEFRAAAIALARGGGTVVSVGLGADDVAVSWFDVIRREITILGSNAMNDTDFATALDLVAAGTVRTPMEAGAAPLSAGPALFAALDRGAIAEKVFLDPAQSPPS